MDFTAKESTDGVRFSWNFWPNTKLQATRVVIPVGCLYTPLKEPENMNLADYSPVTCRMCRAILNPSCNVDFRFKIWLCPFCGTRNNFPNHYAQHIAQDNLPPELITDYSTIEYVQVAASQQKGSEYEKPVFLLVVDTAVDSSELVELKDSLQQSINFIPEESMIGLITYGRHTYVHELGFTACPKAFVFRGDKELTPQQIHAALDIDPRQQRSKSLRRFLVPVSECEFALNSILDDLQPDPWPVNQGERRTRCVGTAFSVAVSLLEASGAGRGSRIVSLLAGACTFGPGMVISTLLSETIRSH